jgi:hypothetical protein
VRARVVVAGGVVVALAVLGVASLGRPAHGTASAVPAPPFSPRAVAVQQASVVSGRRPLNGRYEYVFLDGDIYVYPEGSPAAVEHIAIPPTKAGTRGIAVDVPRHLLYIAYGGDGGDHGTGSLLKYDLVRDRIVWQKAYPIGIDSFGVSADGKLIFMPLGEAEQDPYWYVLRTSDGRAIARIKGGEYPHNTIVTPTRVYMGPRGSSYLTIASAKSPFHVLRRVRPLVETVRPFTINGKETLVFTTASLHRGFQVSSIATGKVLYTVEFGPVASDYIHSAPSHGISLSPNEKQLWVVDSPASVVRVFDVSKLPARAPKQIAALPTPPMQGQEEGCGYDCERSGWVQHSLDGRYVYVGDSGNVYSTNPPALAFALPTLRNTRKHLEIDWRNGQPVATSTRAGMGHKH